MEKTSLALNDIYEDDTDFSILITLHTFHSLNLKSLSKIMGIPESTLLRKIKELLKKGSIILDQNATVEKRGKYYQLSKELSNVLTNQMDDIFQIKREEIYSNREKVKHALKSVVAISSTNLQLAKITSKFVENIPELSKLIDIKRVQMNSTHIVLNFHTTEEFKEFSDLTEEYFAKIKKFENNLNGVPDLKHTLHMFLCPVGILNSDVFLEKLNEK